MAEEVVLYRCTEGHDTHSAPKLKKCPFELWECALCGGSNVAHVAGHRFKTGKRLGTCDLAVDEVLCAFCKKGRADHAGGRGHRFIDPANEEVAS